MFSEIHRYYIVKPLMDAATVGAGLQNRFRNVATQSITDSLLSRPVFNKDFKVVYIDCAGLIKVCSLTITIA